MPELKDVQNQYNTTLAAVKAKMEETKGRPTTPAEEEELDKAFEALDGFKSTIDRMEKVAAHEDNLKAHTGYSQTSTGHVDLAVGQGGADADAPKNADGTTVEGKWTGVMRGSKFVPMFHEDQLKAQPYLKATMTQDYRDAFNDLLKGSFAEMTPQKQQVLLQGKALSESANIGGGFAVPIDFLNEVIVRLPGMSVFQDNARIITTARDRVQAPRIKPNATFPTMYTSAVVMTMVSETPSASSAQVDPIFEAVPINVNTAKLETLVSRNLLSDAQFDVAGYLAEEFRRAALLGKDQKFLSGTGVNEPLGITSDTEISTITSASAGVLAADDIKELIYSLAVQYHTGSMLGFSLNVLKTIRKLKDGDGNYIWSAGFNHGLDDKVPATIEGFPYIVSDFLPSVATGKIVAFFGNPRFYWIVNRLDMSMEVLREVYAEQNQLAYLAFLRFGGHTVVPEAFRTLTIA